MVQTTGEIISRLEEMRPRYKAGFSSSDREYLEKLNQRIFHRVITNTGCSDCYRDAYIIIYNKLKKGYTMPTLSNYCLKAGAVIHSFGSPDYYTLEVPDKVAEEYLRKNPENICEFQRFPNNWRERIARKAQKQTAQVQEQASEATPSAAKNTQQETTESEGETKTSKRK